MQNAEVARCSNCGMRRKCVELWNPQGRLAFESACLKVCLAKYESGGYTADAARAQALRAAADASRAEDSDTE